MRWTEATLRGALPVYLLEITWAGRVYRFSTIGVVLSNADGDELSFAGELEEPDFEESTSRSGVSDGGPSIPIEVVFPVDVAAEHASGRPLDAATGELSMVFLSADGEIGQTYEQRFVLASGYAEMPIYAFPDGPVGLATFSLEQPPSDDGNRLISPDAVISIKTWPSSPAMGAVYPTVIGAPGTYINSAGTSRTKPATPAYLVATDKLLVAGHEVQAGAAITLFDADGTTTTATPTFERDGLGRLVSVVDISGASGSFDKTGSKFFAAWPSNSGGMTDPLQGGLLTRLGDVCVWALTRSSIGADIGRWVAARPLLNTVSLAGYLDDLDESPWDFLQDVVFPLIPLEVQQTPKGVIPLPRFLDRRPTDVVAIVDEGPDFSPDGPMETQTERGDIANTITLSFAKDIEAGEHRRRLTVQATADTSDPDTFASLDSVISASRYSRREKTIKTDWVYSSGSAGAILSAQLRSAAYPARTRTYRASPRWGWLSVGDAILLTSDSLSLTDRLVEVTGRAWVGDSWRFVLAFDEYPARDA